MEKAYVHCINHRSLFSFQGKEKGKDEANKMSKKMLTVTILKLAPLGSLSSPQ